jgi:hypothetical protein
MERWRTFVALILLFSFLASCRQAPAPDAAAGEGGWLKGASHAKFDAVAKQLRGFDVAMVETGYQYRELFWAGEQQNWEYADYQAKKIRTAIENGLERRPNRAASAQSFLTIVLPAVEEAIAKRDRETFRARFANLTSTCRTCHEAERVAFVPVAPPSALQTAER